MSNENGFSLNFSMGKQIKKMMKVAFVTLIVAIFIQKGNAIIKARNTLNSKIFWPTFESQNQKEKPTIICDATGMCKEGNTGCLNGTLLLQ